MKQQLEKNFQFKRIKAGYQISSKSGMLKKLKWKVLAYIFNKSNIKYNNNNTFKKNKKRMIQEYITKHSDRQFYYMLRSITDKMVQPALLSKFNDSKQKALQEYLIRYEEWEIC